MKDILQIICEWLDDKTLVIFALLAIAMAQFAWAPGSEQVLGNIVSGLLGVALGRALPKSNGSN